MTAFAAALLREGKVDRAYRARDIRRGARCALPRLHSALRANSFPSSRSRALRTFLAILVLFVVVLAIPAFAAPSFPPLTGRVVDEAQILSAQTKADLDQKLADLEAKTRRQFVVVTLKDLQGYDIADYGYQLGRAWGIGGKAENDGVLLIVAPSERKVRIEVGYGLEPILTDALCSVILQTQVLPKFRAGDMEGGVVAGAEAVMAQLGLDPAQAQKIAQAAKARQQNEGGGFPIWLLLIIIFFFVLPALGRRLRARGLDAALPWIVLGGMSGRGGGSSWGGGGGGFSGGGGSFGGGGSSGGW